MPDRKKVLHELEHQVADADWCDNDWKDNVPIWMLRDALALLREQEPVKPVVDARDGWYRCGKCGNSLASGERVRSFGSYKWPVYCEKCGKVLKWDA